MKALRAMTDLDANLNPPIGLRVDVFFMAPAVARQSRIAQATAVSRRGHSA